MRKLFKSALLALALLALPSSGMLSEQASARSNDKYGNKQSRHVAGKFDYYVLTLSWSPTYCADNGRKGRDKLQCYSGRKYGFVVHGLWPQYNKGYPANCRTSYNRPSEKLIDLMTRIMPSRGLVKHEWRKHGTCSGQDPVGYFKTTVKAYNTIKRPPELKKLARPVLMTKDEIIGSFLAVNPDLPKDGIVVTCGPKKLREVRICLNKKGQPRSCTPYALKGMCRSNKPLRILSTR